MSKTQILIVTLLTLASDTFAQSGSGRAHFSKLSADLQTQTIQVQEGSISGASMVVADVLLELIVRTTDTFEMQSKGFDVQSVLGEIATVRVNKQRLSELIELNSVSYIQSSRAERPAQVANAKLMNVNDIHSGALNNTPLRGKGVVVAIYDSGIDWKHADFRKEGDTTQSRILAVWDQTGQSDASHKSPSDFNYGVEYTQSDINAELSGFKRGFVLESDRTGHGTAVGGIAAGNGGSSKQLFSGVAPDADIIVVKGGDAVFSEAKIIDGLAYLNKKAAQLGKPIVVNVSLGSQYGAHDGSRMYEQAIDAFCSLPGRAVVVSSGNQGDQQIHGEGVLTGRSDSVELSFTIPTYLPQAGQMNDRISVELWYAGHDSLNVVLVSPEGTRFGSASSTSSIYRETSEGVVLLNNSAFGVNSMNGKRNATIQLFDFNGKQPAGGTWKIFVQNLQTSPTERFHAWITETSFGTKAVLFDSSPIVTPNYHVASPGNSAEAITVGAYGFRTTWNSHDGNQYAIGEANGIPTSYTNAGPRADGRVKPEILAPGTALGSALSSDAFMAPAATSSDRAHGAWSGTSFAAPQISGLVALMFQINPAMTASTVKENLKQCSSVDDAISLAGKEKTGYGKADALRSILSLSKSRYLSIDYIALSARRTANNELSLRWAGQRSGSAVGYEVVKVTANGLEVVDSYKRNTNLSTGHDSSYTCVVSNSSAQGSTSYAIREIDDLGREKVYGTIALNTLSVVEEEQTVKPELSQNYPNPCNPTTCVSFSLPTQQHVALRVYDMLGREIRTLVNDEKSAGKHTVTFDGAALSSGTYLLALEAGSMRMTRKMQVLK